jgi:hypothetical protein
MKWRCMYTQIEHEQAIFGPAARFCPVPGSTQRGPWARKSREKKQIQITLARTAAMDKIREMHVHVV